MFMKTHAQTRSVPSFLSNSPAISSPYAPFVAPCRKMIFPKNVMLNPCLNHGLYSSIHTVPRTRVTLHDQGGWALRSGEPLSELEADDGFYIRRCVELARKAVGYTSPNPMVGCVIVNNGKIVGEGFHPKAGQPHAEVFALRDAGDAAENATAYVSLEPCNHYGRTPPCTEALIKAKVKKVVVGMVDPNPLVASKGIDRLRDAGIEVIVGIEEDLCKKLNEAFVHQMLTGKPFVTLRYSLSLDGRIVDEIGEKATESGGYYSCLLQEYDAVVYSSSLLIKKHAIPISREPGSNQPLQVIFAKCTSSPIEVPALSTDVPSRLMIFREEETTVDSQGNKSGIETVVLDKIKLKTVLEYCKRQGLCSILLDLGGNLEDYDEILFEGFEVNLFKKVVVEVTPTWGGSKNHLMKHVDDKVKLKDLTTRVSGENILLEGYFD